MLDKTSEADKNQPEQQAELPQHSGVINTNGANPTNNATGGAGGTTSTAGGTIPPIRSPPPPAGNMVTGAVLVNAAVENSIAPLQQSLENNQQLLLKQGDVLATMAKVLIDGQNPSAMILSPAQIAAASVAPMKKKDKRKENKRKDESSSSSSDSSSEYESPEAFRRVLDCIESVSPIDTQGFRKQVFQGFGTQGKLAMSLLRQDPSDVRATMKVLKMLVCRVETSEEVTNFLVSEPRVGLTTTDYAFSALCNEDEFRSKTKPTKLAEGAAKHALTCAGHDRNGGGMGSGAGGSGAGRDGPGGSRGASTRGSEKDFNRHDYDERDRDHRFPRDNKWC